MFPRVREMAGAGFTVGCCRLLWRLRRGMECRRTCSWCGGRRCASSSCACWLRTGLRGDMGSLVQVRTRLAGSGGFLGLGILLPPPLLISLEVGEDAFRVHHLRVGVRDALCFHRLVVRVKRLGLLFCDVESQRRVPWLSLRCGRSWRCRGGLM